MKQMSFLLVSLFFLLSVPLVDAGVNVGISIGVPAPLVFEEPPDVVVVPSGSAYVYMVPDSPGLYFYNNFWYRFHEGHWFRSGIYNGSWVYLDTRRVPRFVLDVPPDYYSSLPSGYYRIHYGDLHRNWRTWDRGRHWNRYDWYKHEYREHGRRDHDRGRDLHDGGHGPRGDGHKPGDKGHGLKGDGHKPGDTGHGLRGDGHKPGDTGGKKHDGGGTKQYGGTQKGAEGRKTQPDDKKGMEHKR